MSDLPSLPPIRLGRYRHYKGGLYDVVGVVRHSETLEPLVLYRALYGEGGLWVRPHAMFIERVVIDGREQDRFAWIESSSPDDGTDDPYRLVEATPSPDTYRHLRHAAGLGAKTDEAAARGLPATLYAVQVMHEGVPIGMGRIVGDGGCFFQVTDIAVLPAHQKRGLGKRIMAALMAWLEIHATPSAYVSLIADGDAKHLYARFGFRETAPASVGMWWMPKR